MQITINNTTKIVHLNGIPCRIWEGETKSGIKVHCYIPRIAADKDANLEEFEKNLMECQPPSEEIESIPARMVL